MQYIFMKCKIIVVGDFNLEPSDPKLESFFDLNDMTNFMKSKTCFKTAQAPA